MRSSRSVGERTWRRRFCSNTVYTALTAQNKQQCFRLASTMIRHITHGDAAEDIPAMLEHSLVEGAGDAAGGCMNMARI